MPRVSTASQLITDCESRQRSEFIASDHLTFCSYTIPLQAQLQKHYGAITPQVTINDIVPIVQTGDLHVAIFDLTDSTMHLANARRSGAPGPAMAYDRTFLALDMKSIFNEPAPTVL